jgi:hypothetical protein
VIVVVFTLVAVVVVVDPVGVAGTLVRRITSPSFARTGSAVPPISIAPKTTAATIALDRIAASSSRGAEWHPR